MSVNRIYLGVDINTNLAIALERSRGDTFLLTVSNGSRDRDFCQFPVTEEALDGVLHNRPVESEACSGRCTVRTDGDEIIFEFQQKPSKESGKCTLSTASFMRVVQMAKNRICVE